jgi:uncharacterized protein YceH (UPF0502 family)
MDIRLTPYEARVIGCLLEKHRTTPEHYPLLLNALTNACNQKSNRNPMLALDEATVQDTIDTLKLPREPGKREARFAHLFGSEVEMRETAAPADAVSAGPGMDFDRVDQLEQMIHQLRDEMASLQVRLDRISPNQDPKSR